MALVVSRKQNSLQGYSAMCLQGLPRTEQDDL